MVQDNPLIVKSHPKWIVKNVTTQDNHILVITFATEERKIYDCTPLLDDGIFAKLKNPDIFKLAHVDGGTVVWNDEIDIAPEELYNNSVAI